MKLLTWWVSPIVVDDDVEEVGSDQDRHDHGGRAHRSLEDVEEHAKRQPAIGRRAMPIAPITPSAAASVAVATPA